jgi:regulator of cell morphogenesis and NO signaling
MKSESETHELAAIVRCILKPHHSLLREEVARAGELIGNVVVDQRPPLCRTLLPLIRLFQQFREELKWHLELQEKEIFPGLLEMEGAKGSGKTPSGTAEALRLLKYGHVTLTSGIDEMRQLTHGFVAPDEACKSYGELLDVLAEIEAEIAAEVRMESSILLAPAAQRADREWHGGPATRECAGTAHGLRVM